MLIFGLKINNLCTFEEVPQQMSKFKILFFSLCVVVLAFLVYRYMYKDHRDISKEKAQYDLTAVALASAFGKDYNAATDKYLNQTLIVRGSITEIEPQALTLDNRVYITTETPFGAVPTLGTTVAVKGRCIGYDELLEWVKIDQAALIE